MQTQHVRPVDVGHFERQRDVGGDMKDLLSSLWRGCVFFLKVVGVVVCIALLGLLFPVIFIVVFIVVRDFEDWLRMGRP